MYDFDIGLVIDLDFKRFSPVFQIDFKSSVIILLIFKTQTLKNVNSKVINK